MPDNEAPRRRRFTDNGEIEPPFAEDRFGLFFLLGLEHHEHALLALRQHHLVGAHAGLAARHPIEIERHPEIAFGAHLYGRTGQPGRAHVLDGDDAALGHDLETGFEQQLFREWIADLHGRPLLFGVGAELGRCHGGAVNAVAAGLRAEIDDRHADARSRGVENLVGLGEADRHGIDQDVAVVAAVEAHFAADRRHTEGIAVAADASDHARDQTARLGMTWVAERQRIEAGDRPRAHGEDIAQDAANAGRRALVGLDVARVVVALHLEHDGKAVADVDHAGIFARPLDHPGRLGGQRAQMDFRRFVRAVLVPHRREDAELGEARRAADEFFEARVLVRLEAVLGDQLGRDGRFVGGHGLDAFYITVMAGLVPAIHVSRPACKVADVRHKAGHDVGRQAAF